MCKSFMKYGVQMYNWSKLCIFLLNICLYIGNFIAGTPNYHHSFLSSNLGTILLEGRNVVQCMSTHCIILTVRQTFASRSFSVAGPTLWNRLPNHIKDSNSIDIFNKNLKTFLFANGNF